MIEKRLEAIFRDSIAHLLLLFAKIRVDSWATLFLSVAFATPQASNIHMDQTRIDQLEQNWIARSRSGDHRAFRCLYDQHVTGLYRFLAQFSGQSHEVEDWVQRSFIKAYERLNQFDGRSSFGTWLFKIGLNEMRSDLRRSKIVSFEPESSAEHVATSDDANAFAWTSAMRQWLDALDDQKRSVFILYEVEGYSHKEIADLLGIEESHSRTILARAKSWLRTQWEQQRRAL